LSKLTYRGGSYEVGAGESVLDALLRHGLDVQHSCRSGACQSCMMRASAGSVPAVAQQGLKSTLAAQGYFLSCLCRPEQDLTLENPEGLNAEATIESLERLTPTVLRVRLRPHVAFSYRAGQYVVLRRQDGLARSYSLASLPIENTLELHVRRAPQGRMTGWLFDEAKENDLVSIRGPAGQCFYTAGNQDQALLMAGTGTGLAPLAGICRDALREGHQGPIHLYHGALRPEGLYLTQELQQLARAHENFRYHPVVVQGGSDAIRSGALDQVIAADHARLTGWRGFVCGDPVIVGVLTKKLFLAGMASREIFADPFVEAPVG
jgi:CDP-4-dehydro-6-deoxyglucose reductase, E3